MKVFNRLLILLVLTALILANKEKGFTPKSRSQMMKEMQENAGTHDVTVEITAENFESLKKSSKYLLALVVTSDRSTLKLIMDYPQLHHNLIENGVDGFTLGLVDHEGWPEFAKSQDIKKLPSLVLYSQEGQKKDVYKGLNYIEDMFNWVVKTVRTTKTNSIAIPNGEWFEARKEQFPEFLMFFGTSPDTEEFKFFEQMAKKRQDLVLVHTFDLAIREACGLKRAEQQGLALFSKREESLNMNYINHYKGKLLDLNEIKTFLKIYGTSTIQMVRPWDTQKIHEGELPNLTLALDQFDYFSAEQEMESLMTPEELVFLELRPKLTGLAHINILNVTARNREEVSKMFELDLNFTLPRIFLTQNVRGKPMKKYIFSGEKVTAKTMLQWMKDIKNKKILPISLYEKSYTQEQQDALLVKSVTLENWDHYVYKNKQDVLVFFYSIGCYDCAKLKSMYAHLAYKLKENPNLLLVRCNIGDNDIDGVSVKKVPEFQFFRSNDKDHPIKFIYTNRQNTLIEALKQGVTYPWVTPIADEDVDLHKVIVDQTDLELKFLREEAERQKQQQSQIGPDGLPPLPYQNQQPQIVPEAQDEVVVSEEQQPQSSEESKKDL